MPRSIRMTCWRTGRSRSLSLIHIYVKIVDVNIRRLRMKIEDEPSNPRHIMTVWGYGYRWNV